MKDKIKNVVFNWKVLIVIFGLIFTTIILWPQLGASGVSVRGIEKNSAAADAGMVSPTQNMPPTQKMHILEINDEKLTSTEDFERISKNIPINQTVILKTTYGIYTLRAKEAFKIIDTGKIENTTISEIQQVIENNTRINKTVNKTISNPVFEKRFLGYSDLGISVGPVAKTNLRTGLDLQGGTRVLLSPEVKISKEDMDFLIENMKARLNVYGLSDLSIRQADDFSGNQYILVEIAGVSQEEVQNLLSKQGKFEAKIGDKVVFRGGSDITYVCRSADCSGIDPQAGCGSIQNGIACQFRFSISLSPAAAKRQADISRELSIVPSVNARKYLNESLDLYLDNQKVDSLQIAAELRGQSVTDIVISGSGSASSQQAATTEALANMKKLQTVLITGSLPIKLNIIKVDNVSPALGEQFVNNAIFVVMLAGLGVMIVLMIIYRNPFIAIPIFLTAAAEVYMTLGVSAMLGWTIDLAAIAGVLAAVGTGVDDQVVITDETREKEANKFHTFKDKMKSAWFIIFGSYLTLAFAMLPLLFMGAGLLRGFALTTIVGITIGVLITRPAYAYAVEVLSKK